MAHPRHSHAPQAQGGGIALLILAALAVITARLTFKAGRAIYRRTKNAI